AGLMPLLLLGLVLAGYLVWLVWSALTSPIPLLYNVKSVFVRWRATLATVLGVALVVTVYLLMQAMAAGLEKSSANTGDPRNVMIARKGSTAESSSQVTREQFRILKYFPEIARDERGRPLVSADLVVIMNLPRRNGSGEANVTMRGVTPLGRELRPQVRLVAGRWFEPGKREAVVSVRMAERFANTDIGQRFKTGGHELTVVGWFEGGDSAFDSEMWMDADEARSIFNRHNYSSVLARAAPGAAQALIRRIESDRRLPLKAEPETQYYAEQTRTARPIRILGSFLATAMSIGAVFAAMNTMYASVGARTREIGTLRVLGFRRRTILASFNLEGAILAGLGGVLGCALAWLAQTLCVAFGVRFGTLSFNTFSEVIFQFRVTPALLMEGMLFAVAVGIAGSLLPAIRAARLPVIAALRAV
ncbi:MAG: ABC transporter permease, partial [Verrucomicrobiales bacterium]|nr:ABC transporter permease [Verrucomicrobiales bacterium]